MSQKQGGHRDRWPPSVSVPIPVLVAIPVAVTVAWQLPISLPIPMLGAANRARISATAIDIRTCWRKRRTQLISIPFE